MAYCFFNGKFLPEAEARVSVFDLGFLRGWGVFDFAYASGNKVFYGFEHLQRLQNSAAALKITLPYSIETIHKKTEELLQKNGLPESLIRWVLSGGAEEGGGKPTFVILNERYIAPPKELSERGAALHTIALKREIPSAKSLNYQIRYSHLAEMGEAGIFELLYVTGEEILECTTSNIFLVKEGVLYTPLEEVLPGITRRVVIDLARSQGIKVMEKKLSLDNLKNADEVFITSTTKKILPVKKVDDNQFAAPGEITKSLQMLFDSHEREYFSKA